MTDDQKKNISKLIIGAMEQNAKDGFDTMAHQMRDVYSSFRKAGFTDEQAMSFVNTILEASIMSNNH